MSKMYNKNVKVITIRATLEWFTPVRREIEIREDQTLVTLHEAIQRAFQWYDDHLYAFFMSGREWDRSSVMYSEPESLKEAGEYDPNEKSAYIKIRNLNLKVGQKIAYIYDFGDNLSLSLIVRRISSVDPEVKYPRVTSLRGFSPEEYHYHIGYSKEVKKELRNGLPKIVKLDIKRERDLLKKWSDSSAEEEED
jgi:hypothetical protein